MSAIPDGIYARLLQHEGGNKKVTVDTGGTTKGGISARGTGLTPAQIKNLDPTGIRKQWQPFWDQSGKHFKDPRVAEIALNYAGNAGPPTFGKHLQETLNTLNRNAKPLGVDGVMGPDTRARITSVGQTQLGNALLDRFKKHHNYLVKENPAKYGAYQKGWANRRAELRKRLSEPAPPQKVVPTVTHPTAPAPTLAKQGGVPPKVRDILSARKATNTSPTPAQKDSGNYAKGRINFKGLHIAIENPKGSIRRGVSPAGKKWETKMKSDYGYFTRGSNSRAPVAIDGDAVDVFVGDNLESDLVVAIDQYFNGSYDETKFVVGVANQQEGESLYLSNYQKGWKLGPTTTTTVAQLRAWLKNGRHKKPFKGQQIKAATMNTPGIIKTAGDPLQDAFASERPATLPVNALGGAAAGGVTGAGVGGIAGLLRVLFDNEDDDFGSGLGKVMSGVGIGGVVGGTGGAVAGSAMKDHLGKSYQDTVMKHDLREHPLAHPAVARRAAGETEIPIKALLDVIIKGTPEAGDAYGDELVRANLGDAYASNLAHNPYSIDSMMTSWSAINKRNRRRRNS